VTPVTDRPPATSPAPGHATTGPAGPRPGVGEGVWADLVGQDRTVEVLVRAVAEPAGMTHAWLFTGPPGSGRSTAARAFAAALQCPRGGCGECASCHTALEGTHADVEVVRTEGVSFLIKDVRSLVGRAATHPSGGRWQVLVVEDADRLAERTSNVLLKAIEEPTPRTVWLLCAPSVDDVLPTIRSRCRHLSLRTPSSAAVADVLVRRDGVDPGMAGFAARAAQGHIGRARRLATDEQARLRRHDVMRLPQSLDRVSAAITAAAELVAAATEDADEASSARAAAETEHVKRALGVGVGARQPAGASAALGELEKEQRRRATRAKRDGIDRALVDLAGFYRDVLAVQAGAEVELVNEEMREAVTAVRIVRPVMPLRSNGPFSLIQSAVPRLVRCRPPPSSLVAAVVVPSCSTACSTSCWRWRSWIWLTVVSAGAAPCGSSVYDALITPKTLPPCEASSGSVCSTPEQPWTASSACPCVSWPRTKVTATLLHSTVPSSGSVTETLKARRSPNAKVPLSTGEVIRTVGAVLPTVIVVLADPVLPLESVTVRRAVY
jgi:DNA polymerase-3 subunit delta'